jgi:hypothetical protein
MIESIFFYLWIFEIKIVKLPKAIDVKNANDNYFHLFFILMTNLDHSLVHVLNKQENIYNV